MQRFTLKIACFLFCLFFALALDNALAAKSSVRHISNKIKIVRPETPSPESASAKSEKPEKPAEEKTVVAKPEEGPQPAQKTADEKADRRQGQTERHKKQADSETMRKETIGLLGEKQNLYSRKGKIDPFAPFVQGQEPKQGEKAEKKLQRRKPQTPLERVSLGQLRLTAIMETPEQKLAMVEEASGKGYVVKKGTYIGDQGGRITKLLSDAIVIEEKYLDVFGNVDVRKKQLKLQK